MPPAPDAAREAAWRAKLSPYYREFGIDADKIPAGPGRAPFSKEAADVLEAFKPAVVSFHFGLPEKALLARRLVEAGVPFVNVYDFKQQGQNWRKIRKAVRLSQGEMGALVGLGEREIRYIEAGERSPERPAVIVLRIWMQEPSVRQRLHENGIECDCLA